MHTKRYERIRAYKTDAEEKAKVFSEKELKAKKANGFSEKQTKAKKADIRYTIKIYYLTVIKKKVRNTACIVPLGDVLSLSLFFYQHDRCFDSF